jgi:hypothetical protein
MSDVLLAFNFLIVLFLFLYIDLLYYLCIFILKKNYIIAFACIEYDIRIHT